MYTHAHTLAGVHCSLFMRACGLLRNEISPQALLTVALRGKPVCGFGAGFLRGAGVYNS